ncbi:NAD-dependent epimerase/dehydratase family protein [Limimaricola cinnabarinus]|uniref:NAD-dependent epimerase/dehydratase family protein n=1 Tax=Limimaricola cinnabarinus TaxID=1125964 RepID=UPI00249051A0|nr:NAD(P)-dependent oxidoreductase [Limimaricola cinnabarinus]
MGAVIAVTGAAGFLGRAVVARARAQGHELRAISRGAAPPEWAGDTGIEVVHADLRRESPPLDGVSAVIHAAARMGGDDAAQAEGTVAPSARLLDHAAGSGARLVLVSSISVLGPAGLAPFARVDEETPIEPRPERRDAYARAKIAQERDARAIAARHGAMLRIVRPGAIFGPGHLWNAHMGVTLGPLALGPRHAGELPLCWLSHAAQILLLAATAPQADPVELIHALDDDRPDRARFLAALGRRGLPLGWRALDTAAGLLTPLAPRLPGLLRREVLRARLMPLRYDNARAHRLGFRPEADFETAMAAARGAA